MADWRNRIIGHGTEKPDQLLANPANWRIHPKAQQEALAGVLDEVGWVQDVIVNQRTGHLVDGHLRVTLALRNNEPEIPVVYVDLDENEEGLVLASLDPIAAMAAADRDKLDELMQSINSDNPAVQQMMAEIAETNGLEYGKQEPAEDPGAQVDKAEELRVKWGVESGQMWQLGEHRLICGDCTDRAVVERVMGGEKAEIGFTSPPYLDFREYSGNELSLDTLLKFIPLMVSTCNYSVVNLGLKFEDGEVVKYWDSYFGSFEKSGAKLLAWNVWDKTQAGTIASATNMFFITHEWIFVFGDKRKKLNRTIPNDFEAYEQRHGKNWREGIDKRVRQADGSMENTTSGTYTHHQLHSVIQQVPELGRIRAEHPAPFPIGLPEKYIVAMTNQGNIVYEPFSGSGTTICACEQTGRKCRAVEISPAYVAVALQRWADMTGQTPELIDSLH